MRLRNVFIISLGLLLSFSLIATAFGENKRRQSLRQKNAIVILPQNLEWTQGPAYLPPGSKMVIIEGDPSLPGPFTVRLQLPPHYKIPAHWHPAIEHLTILSGIYHFGLGDQLDTSKGEAIPAGGYLVIPKNTNHYGWTDSEGASLQLHGIGPWSFRFVHDQENHQAQ